jgi:CDGSH-type Zn-finger protein
MAEVRIRALKNGPLEVSGSVDIVAANGETKQAGGEAIYLCRCGQSQNKPYCDGSHRTAGFRD